MELLPFYHPVLIPPGTTSALVEIDLPVPVGCILREVSAQVVRTGAWGAAHGLFRLNGNAGRDHVCTLQVTTAQQRKPSFWGLLASVLSPVQPLLGVDSLRQAPTPIQLAIQDRRITGHYVLTSPSSHPAGDLVVLQFKFIP